MSRVYEALKKAEKERKQTITRTEVSSKLAYEGKTEDTKRIDKEKVRRYRPKNPFFLLLPKVVSLIGTRSKETK